MLWFNFSSDLAKKLASNTKRFRTSNFIGLGYQKAPLILSVRVHC